MLAPGTDASKGFCFRPCQAILSGSEWLLADYRNRGVIIEAVFWPERAAPLNRINESCPLFLLFCENYLLDFDASYVPHHFHQVAKGLLWQMNNWKQG